MKKTGETEVILTFYLASALELNYLCSDKNSLALQGMDKIKLEHNGEGIKGWSFFEHDNFEYNYFGGFK